MDLTEITSLVRNSNHGAFKLLYEDQFNHVNDFIFYKTRDRNLAMDITQEVFSRIWLNRSKLDVKKSIKSFLLKIAHNLVIDHYRKKSSSEISLQEEHIERDNYSIENNDADSINTLLDQLPKNLREVFLLSKVEGLTYKEIAEIYEVSHKTVDSWIQKAFMFLRKNLLIILLFLRNLI